MLHLRVYGRADSLTGIGEELEELGEARNVAVAQGVRPGYSRASAAVGVGISITTIPAAAYLGVAAGLGEATKAMGALGVLGVNVAMLVTSGTLTLGLQRRLAAGGWRTRSRRQNRSRS